MNALLFKSLAFEAPSRYCSLAEDNTEERELDERDRCVEVTRLEFGLDRTVVEGLEAEAGE